MPPGTLNLKQRLAALSQSTSSPSSYNDPPSTSSTFSSASSAFRSTIKRKAQAHAPWLGNLNFRREQLDEGEWTAEQVQQVQMVIPRMIYQAGVDYETRPMVIFNASALPDPERVPYDLLLARILDYLNLYVEADYTVVFFAVGSSYTPSWNWVWKAYRSLSRKYRKNLKQLYIVHPSFFSKMLFSLAGAIISPKFFAKIVYISTLSELAYHVPLTQIDIPPAVYKENLKHEASITLPVPSRSNLFGVPLEDLMGFNGEKGGLPRVVRDAITYIYQYGLHEEGLFRRSPSSALLRAAQEAYDRGNVVSLESFGDPHLAAVLIKKFLRDLPSPVFGEGMYGVISGCPMPLGNGEEGEESAVRYVREEVLPLLAPCAYILLSSILQLMHDIARNAERNKMNATNLAIVLTPNLVKGSNPVRDVAICVVQGVQGAGAPAGQGPFTSFNPASSSQGQGQGRQGEKTTLGTIIALCIRRYYEIFDEVPDRTEASRVPQSSLPPLPSSQAHTQSYLTSSAYASPSTSPSRGLLSPQGHGQGLSPVPSPTFSTASEASYVIADEDDEEFEDDDVPLSVGQAGGHGRKQSRNVNRNSVQGMVQQFENRANSSATPASPTQANFANATSTQSRARAKSVVSTESKSSFAGAGHRSIASIASISKSTAAGGKGTITIGRGKGGGNGKGSASGVEAVGVTAEGFFSDPNGTPKEKGALNAAP